MSALPAPALSVPASAVDASVRDASRVTRTAARRITAAAYGARARLAPVSTPAYTRLQVDERRRQLLERAMELFATHGYDELSMAKIAREAGVSKPLLYHYFPNKRDLFEAVL